MALCTLVIEYGGRHYGTQISAPSAKLALEQYFDVEYPKSGRQLLGESAPKIGAKDIIHISRMEPLINMWVSQAGRDGAYASVICSRTVTRRSI
jgi:hypothetical protein